MYVPDRFAMLNARDAKRFLQSNVFATLAGSIVEEIHLAYAPVAFDAEPSPLGSIRFHLAAANPMAKLQDNTNLKVSILGPHAYVSPDWYISDGSVPTWNYLAVEGSGRVRRLNENECRQHLETLVAQEETKLRPKSPWTVARLSDERMEQLIAGIVGFHLVFESLEGKIKLSQNRSRADIDGVIAGLERRGNAAADAVVESMRKCSIGRECP